MPEKDAFDLEAEKFFKEEHERAVKEMREALDIQRVLDLFVKYINEEVVQPEMTLIDALSIIEKRKFELADLKPEDNEEFSG